MRVVGVQTLTERMQTLAYVEVECGVDHSSIWIPGHGNACRYARGYVEFKKSGIRVRGHDCHWCNGFWLMKATTPKEQQICDNCHGPARTTGQESCWPDLLMVDDFVDPLWKEEWRE